MFERMILGPSSRVSFGGQLIASRRWVQAQVSSNMLMSARGPLSISVHRNTMIYNVHVCCHDHCSAIKRA